MIEASNVMDLGTPGPMRDALVASVLSGEKTATSSLLAQYEDSGEPLPRLGRQELIDSEEQPMACVEIVAVDVIRLGDVDLQLALEEGEGFESVAQWRAAHERFWAEEVRPGLCDPTALPLDDDTRVVVERFRLVGPGPAPQASGASA